MKLKRFSFTFISGIFFLITLSNAGLLFPRSDVSRETVSRNAQNKIVPGVTMNGAFSIIEVSEPAHTPMRMKLPNKARTLRAFVGSNNEDTFPALFVESLKPHLFITIIGDFLISESTVSLHWQNNHTLSFQVQFLDGRQGVLSLDLVALNSTFVEESLASDVFVPLVHSSINSVIQP